MASEMKDQLDAALLENARLRRLAESRRERILAITASTQHNHITRDVKPIGQCPGCDTRARLLDEIERLRSSRDNNREGWAGALRELDKYEELRIALSNFMDKPWSSVDWWSPVRAAFFALSPDWPQGDEHFTDPYALGEEAGRLLQAAGPWTEKELDEIRERARVRAAELRELSE
jgi:hypothetical protein